MNFLNNLQINRNQLINPVIDQRTGTQPATPVEGQMYYDMDTSDMWYWDGSWVQFGTGGGSVVAVTGTDGIQSTGGTSPELALDFASLTATNAVVGGDSIAFYDLDLTNHGRRTITNFVLDIDGLLNHNNLLNYDANEHIDMTAIALTAGNGLSYSVGGGSLGINSTIDLNINELAVAAIAAGDFVPFWDTTPTATNKKVTFANFEGAISHANITGAVANEHIDHTTITITAGSGLNYSVGGTNIAADATIDLDINGLSAGTLADADVIAFYDVAGSPGNYKYTIANLRTAMQTGIDLTFGTAGDTGTGTVSTSQSLTVQGTALQMESVASGQSITMAFTTNVTMPGNLIVTGDLTVNGTTTTVNTDNLIVQDPLIKMGDGNSADSVDLGLFWEYDNTGAEYGGIFRDVSNTTDGKPITFYTGGTVEPTTSVTLGTLANVRFGTVKDGTWEGAAIGDTYISSATTWNGKQDALTFGIANTNAVQVNDASVANGNFVRWTATGLEGLTQGEMQTALDVDPLGTDNSTNVTLTNSPGTYDYLTISGQAITLAQINLTTDVTGILPRANGGVGIASTPTNGQMFIGNTTGNVWAVGTLGAATTTGTGFEGVALNVNVGAGTLTVNAKYATTTLSGVVSLATNAEVVTGSNAVMAVVPAALTNWAEQSNFRVARKYSTSIGTGAASTIDVTHGLGGGTRELVVEVYRVASPYDKVYPDIEHLSTTQTRFIFSANPSSNEYRVVIIG